jgi:phytoene dehydrogenase-like protein
MQTRSDVVVVGGGLAGLAAAACAARAGASVTLLERSSEPGGRARTLDREGFLFNVGPHALYRRGAGRALLRELGVDVRGAVPSSSGVALRDGRAYALPTGPASLLTTGLLSVPSKLQLALLLSRLQRPLPTPAAGASFEDWLAAERLRPDVKALLRALARVATYAAQPEDADAHATLEQIRLGLTGGVLYLDGGWQTLVDGLRAAAAEAGARIGTGQRIGALLREGRTVHGVRTHEGLDIEADAVILAVPPAEAARLAAGAAPGVDAFLREARTVRAATLDLGLRALPDPRVRFALGIDHPWYFSVHSMTARLAPEGAVLLHAMRYLGPHTPPGPEVEAELEQLMDVVQPGWRAQVVVRRFVPDLVVSHALVSAAQGGLDGRPAPRVPGTEGLFLAGDWVAAEGMLADASLASARAAARLALGARRAAAA